MLLSYKWMDGMGLGWKSLCGATIRASLCDANKCGHDEHDHHKQYEDHLCLQAQIRKYGLPAAWPNEDEEDRQAALMMKSIIILVTIIDHHL